MLNPVWLHTFKTLIEVGHFTKTAEKLHMTQPGVSQHIKKLEQACQHALIKRENKSFELTEQGRMLYHYALEREQNEKKLLESLSFDNPLAGCCRLACSGSLALQIFEPLLEKQLQNEELSIHLEVAPNRSILKNISDTNIDLGIVTEHPSSREFDYEVIGKEPLCLILPHYYKGKQITPDLLAQCGVISHPDAAHYISLFFEQCGEPSIQDLRFDELPTSSYINQLSQILLPVSKGLGFTVLPISALHSFPNQETLFVADTKNTVYETLFLVKKRNRTLPTRYQTLKEILMMVCKTS
ncbi:LysR family transcriptional regulator [Vibrio azureus]|uniref:HTH lysR-type domain-containing protein n=1 Tax=Vibrio azureus NBRC 104587 TaxID=1219077 RepID=U3AVH9_9VIBR|nr:LysR family transcriptional regulator [Vibrio azureus]AUI88626.1 LysR family transcriptional regulator [Vibrio azureus]GAD77237.1 hypothetical protein VAZ01S_066_00290 [Vibrio azureus NBRC 104587]